MVGPAWGERWQHGGRSSNQISVDTTPSRLSRLSMIDVAMRTKLMLDSVDAWLLAQPSLINKRKRTLLPVVRERTQLADSLARHLLALGLERRAKPTQSLQDYLVTRSPSSDATTESDGVVDQT